MKREDKISEIVTEEEEEDSDTDPLANLLTRDKKEGGLVVNSSNTDLGMS